MNEADDEARRSEVLKIYFDLLKHLTTLDTAAALVVITVAKEVDASFFVGSFFRLFQWFVDNLYLWLGPYCCPTQDGARRRRAKGLTQLFFPRCTGRSISHGLIFVRLHERARQIPSGHQPLKDV